MDCKVRPSGQIHSNEKHIVLENRFVHQSQTNRVLRFCQQLTSLDLGCIILNADITPILESVAEQLEYFSLEETSWVNENFSEEVAFKIF